MRELVVLAIVDVMIAGSPRCRVDSLLCAEQQCGRGAERASAPMRDAAMARASFGPSFGSRPMTTRWKSLPATIPDLARPSAAKARIGPQRLVQL
jgi:hypothetical protein